jgi:hypothetical protein
MNNTEIQFQLRMAVAKLQTAAPLIDGTAEGRELAKTAIIDTASELSELAAIVGGLME